MAKRFIDTELFNDSWFMELPPESKLFYIYLFTNCDNAGIIDLNVRLAEFQTGIKELGNSLVTVFKQFGEKRIKHLGESYYFMPKFISYQYPKGLNINVKPQKSVIEKLSMFGLTDQIFQTVSKELERSYVTPQEKDIYKDKDKDKDISIRSENSEKINFDSVFNSQWMESVYRLVADKTSYQGLLKYWDLFKVEMESRDDLYRDAKQYRAHFPSWVKIELVKSEKQPEGGIQRTKYELLEKC